VHCGESNTREAWGCSYEFKERRLGNMFFCKNKVVKIKKNYLN